MPPMVGSWEMETLDDPTKWFALARAYLDGSIRLCEQMVSGNLAHNYASAQVIMGLCHHSLELFYKGIIHGATGQLPNSSHNLVELADRVAQIAPKVAAYFASPFGFENLAADLDPKAFEKSYGKEQDQRFRYLHDNTGQAWSGVHGFMPENFLAELRFCSTQYDVLIPAAA